MQLKHPLLAIAIAASMLSAFNASAHEPKVQTQEMAAQDMSGMQGADMKSYSAGSMELHKIMATGMDMPMKMSGDVDKDFATMMTMHHQQAIRMSEVLVKYGRNAELKALARKMQAAQKDEIKQMAAYTK